MGFTFQEQQWVLANRDHFQSTPNMNPMDSCRRFRHILDKEPPTIGKDKPTMRKDVLTEKKKPETIIDDPLNKILRQVVRKLVLQVPEPEIECQGIELPRQTNVQVFDSMTA